MNTTQSKDEVKWRRTRSKGDPVFRARILSLFSLVSFFFVVLSLKADLGIGFAEFTSGFRFVLGFTLDFNLFNLISSHREELVF